MYGFYLWLGSTVTVLNVCITLFIVLFWTSSMQDHYARVFGSLKTSMFLKFVLFLFNPLPVSASLK